MRRVAQPKIVGRRYGWAVVFRGKVLLRCKERSGCEAFMAGWNEEAERRKGKCGMNYATDGRCHNAEPGTYGHECGKPAEWLATLPSGRQSGFCGDCKTHGYEARTSGIVRWDRIETGVK